MAFQLIQMLPSLGQIFTSLINSRNGDKKLSHDNKAEERRLSLQRELADLDRQTQIEIAQGNVAFQVYRLEKEQELQRELAALNDQRQLEIANMQRDTALALPEVHKLFENWPLRNVPSHILNAHHNKHPRP